MTIAHILVGISYPVLIYIGLRVMEPRQVALSLIGLAVLRLVIAAPTRIASYAQAFWAPLVAVVLVASVAAASNHPLSLLLGPSLINLALFLTFSFSLFGSRSTIERLALLQNPDLSAEEVVYCRTVTVVWCAFFMANGAISFWLAVGAELEVWALYTGLIAYLLIGLLFAVEFTYRQWRFRRYVGSVTDPLFRLVFPARVTEAADSTDLPSVSTRPRLEPDVVAERALDDRREWDLRVPHDLACWPGHFPEYAIVPGVVQLKWVMELIESWHGGQVLLSRIEALKFKRPMLPGQELTLVLDRDEHHRIFRFALSADAEVFSSGRIVMGPEEAR